MEMASEAESASPMEMMTLFQDSVVEQGVAAVAVDWAASPREMQRWLPRGSFVAENKTVVIAADIAAAAIVVDAAAMVVVVVVVAVAAASSSRSRMDCDRLRSPGPQKDFAAEANVVAAPPVAVARLSSRCQIHRRD